MVSDINSGKTHGFWNGAQLPQVISVMENSSKPIVAAVDGLALGGGTSWRMTTWKNDIYTYR